MPIPFNSTSEWRMQELPLTRILFIFNSSFRVVPRGLWPRLRSQTTSHGSLKSVGRNFYREHGQNKYFSVKNVKHHAFSHKKGRGHVARFSLIWSSWNHAGIVLYFIQTDLREFTKKFQCLKITAALSIAIHPEALTLLKFISTLLRLSKTSSGL